MSDEEEAYESAEEGKKSVKSKADTDSAPEQSDEGSDFEPTKKKGRGRPKSLKKKTPVKKAAAAKKRGRPSKPTVVDFDPEEEYEVEAIVGHRDYNGKLKYKIRWKNFDAAQDTWEDYSALSCPDLLETYNFKHKIAVPKKPTKAKKRGRSKKTSPKTKKQRQSPSDEDEEESFEADDNSVELNNEDPLAEEYEVSKIIDMRKKNGKREFLVHWLKWSSEYDSWEPEDNLTGSQDIIEKFLAKLEKDKETEGKELREFRKTTDRFTLLTKDGGRRLSRRNDKTQRVKYYDAELSDE